MPSTSPSELDQADLLARFRAEFGPLAPGCIYLDGNSLGRMPLRTAAVLEDAVRRQWGERLIRSWNEGWHSAPTRIGDKIGQLIGAAAGQVAISDSTTVNLFKLANAALDLRPGRGKILSDTFNFPSDLYVLAGIASQRGLRLELLHSADGIGMEPEQVLQSIDADTALVVLSLVSFKSGYRYDAAAITRRAREVGALVLWDLSHAAGAVPLALDAWGVDLAVGCTYKYLNGGPGAPAYLYVRRDLQESMRSPIQGWFGQQNAFAFELEYAPAAGIQRFLCGTPAVLSLLAIEPGVDLQLEAGMTALYAKAVRLSQYLIERFDLRLAPLGYALGSPRDPTWRGAHISLRHPEGYRINRVLIAEMNVIPDFREPDHIRLGLAPLYTSFGDVWEAVERLRSAVEEKRYLKVPAARLAVT
jgi:kynureninase